MAHYIVTGNYTSDALRGMIDNPTDRAAAVKPLVDAAGGKMTSFHFTTGDTDFSMHVDADAANMEGMMAAMIAAGASGAVTNLKTVQAFSTQEFTEMQKRAGAIMDSFKPPHQS